MLNLLVQPHFNLGKDAVISAMKKGFYQGKHYLQTSYSIMAHRMITNSFKDNGDMYLHSYFSPEIEEIKLNSFSIRKDKINS